MMDDYSLDPRQKIVKYENYREWDDPQTGKRYYCYDIRLCILPRELAERLSEPITPDPKKAFLVLDQQEKMSELFPFKTFTYGPYPVQGGPRNA